MHSVLQNYCPDSGYMSVTRVVTLLLPGHKNLQFVLTSLILPCHLISPAVKDHFKLWFCPRNCLQPLPLG